MRVLFTVSPAKSIFLTMVPLAWALRTAGHEVRFASQPGFVDEITQAGLTAVPVGRHANMFRLMEWVGIDEDAIAEGRAGLSPPYDVVTDPAGATWEDLVPAYGRAVESFAYEAFPMLAGLVDFARNWQPDLVIWEPYTLAGPIAAKACGAAHARILWGVDVFALTRATFLRLKAEQPDPARAEEDDYLTRFLTGYARKYGDGFSEDLVTGHFTIDQFPASLQTEADLHYVRMRFSPYGGPAVVPKWLWAPPERPRVGITMGLTATQMFAGFTFSLQDILDSLADLDIEVVATVAETEQAKLDRIPDNARLVPYVPLHALAPTCSVMVHHAGAATLGTIALHAVPQLVLPYHFDEPIFARGLAEQGAALTLDPTEATGANVRRDVLRLLHEPAWREGAARLTDEIRALPTANELVPHLEELTAKYRSRSL